MYKYTCVSLYMSLTSSMYIDLLVNISTSSGSVNLNSHPSPVQLIHDWQLRSVRSSSRNCHSWMGPLPVWCSRENTIEDLLHRFTTNMNSYQTYKAPSNIAHQCNQQGSLLVSQLSLDLSCCLYILWSSCVAVGKWRHLQTCSPLLQDLYPGLEQSTIECSQHQSHHCGVSPL